MILRWVAPNGTTLTFSRDATDYKLTKNYSGLATIPVVHMTQTAPYQDGSTRINSQVTTRTITFEVMIMAPDLETLQSRIRALAVAFQPTGEGHLFYVNEAGEEYWISCIGTNTPTFSTTDRTLNYQRAFITLTAFNPFWYSGSPKTAYISSTGTAFFPFDVSSNFLGWNSSSVSVTNAGDLDTSAVISIVGECVNPKLTNVTTGEVIEVTIAMSAGESFVITTGFGNKTATYTKSDTSVLNGFPYLSSASVLWSLTPGETTISLTNTSFAAASYVRIEWYDRYIAV